jgi:NAD-dependent SIR2 family protein deacetylase
MSALPETPGATPAPAYPVLRHRLAPPPADPPLGSAADLREFVGRHPRLLVLTGAGCSTDSGIPDYRDATGAWKRQDPVEFAPFMRDPLVRARYWARSLIGWRSFGTAVPNAAHHALAALERAGRVCLLVTQNVDGLHQAAGSQQVLDLHGRLDTVACTTCRQSLAREDWQRRLEDANSPWLGLDAPVAPDGDADLERADFGHFHVPACSACGGVVKPDVVFFGESVPAERVRRAYAMVDAAEAMLVVGTSLAVHSGRRFVTRASERGIPVVIVNQGPTRADHLARVRVTGGAGQILRGLVQRFNQVDGVGRAS